MYVLNHCHFCHGEDLTRAKMGAANLSQSALVGADTDGNAIGRSGQSRTAKPADSDAKLSELSCAGDRRSRTIHSLSATAGQVQGTHPASDNGAGRCRARKSTLTGAGTCASCHTSSNALAGIARGYARPGCARGYSDRVLRNPWRASSRRLDNLHT